jgi:hypothetical protein
LFGLALCHPILSLLLLFSRLFWDFFFESKSMLSSLDLISGKRTR